MTNDWDNVKPVGCKHWLVLPAVYSDALSYGDQIAHFCAALNKLIQNNNTLPEYIQQMIQDYINGDVIGEVVQNIVSQFILNVKYPPENLKPAVGDGSADDTEAIQGCINYAKNHNGMAVYIPSGAYSVQSLTLPGDVSLFGFDRYTTKLVLRGGATTPMISSTGTGFSIVGLTLDGNAGIQVENINVLSLISQDVLLRDLILQNGYKLLVYNGTGGHLQVNDIVFGSAVYDCVEISGGSMVQFDNCQFTALSQVGGQRVIDISSDGGLYDFVNNAICPVCCVVSGNDNYIQFSSVGAQNNFSDTGLRNNIIVRGQEQKEYLSGDLNSTIEGSYDQNVNGAYSENISGTFTSVKNSTENITITGSSVSDYKKSRIENIADKKTVNAKDLTFNTQNPIEYKKPTEGDIFNTIPFKFNENNVDTNYNVLVSNNNTPKLTTNVIDVTRYSVDNTGQSNVSDALQSVIDSFPGHTLYLPAGVYNCDKTIYLYGDHDLTVNLILDSNAVIKATSEISDLLYVYYYKNKGQENAYISNRGMFILGGSFDGNMMVSNSVITLGEYSRYVTLNSVNIINNGDAYGLYLGKGSLQSFISNISIHGNTYIVLHKTGCGIFVGSSDTYFNNISIKYNYRGIYIAGSGNQFNNMHIWSPFPNISPTDYDDTWAIYVNGGNNNISNVECDGYRAGITVNQSASMSNILVFIAESAPEPSNSYVGIRYSSVATLSCVNMRINNYKPNTIICGSELSNFSSGDWTPASNKINFYNTMFNDNGRVDFRGEAFNLTKSVLKGMLVFRNNLTLNNNAALFGYLLAQTSFVNINISFAASSYTKLLLNVSNTVVSLISRTIEFGAGSNTNKYQLIIGEKITFNNVEYFPLYVNRIGTTTNSNLYISATGSENSGVYVNYDSTPNVVSTPSGTVIDINYSEN